MKAEWTSEVATKVEAYVGSAKSEADTIVCASGISPSGPIHIGNLRELITVHLVCEELVARGRNAVHLHLWDDYDRLRKVPVDVPPSFEEHLGKPLSEVPDFLGEYQSYAERFMDQFETSVAKLGIHPRYVRQSQAYQAGHYNDQIKLAIAKRHEIFDVLAKYQTEGRHEKSIDERRREYYPFSVYCEQCSTDRTRIHSFDSTTNVIEYECECSPGSVSSCTLGDSCQGKLAWKVDWPMRWSFESVDFEPGGEDHATAGSSYTVGCELVQQIFDGRPPFFIKYAFVGIAGRTKMSSSAGVAPTPAWAMQFLEPCILRWLYVRRKPGDQFEINFGRDLWRLYDEWDAFVKRASSDTASERDRQILRRCTVTSTTNVAKSKLVVPFRLLASAADMTKGNVEQVLRIVRTQHPELSSEENLAEALEPRLSCAVRWATECLPEDERTKIREAFDDEKYAGLPEEIRECLQILLERLHDDLNIEDLTALVYGAPKLQLGLTLDADPTPDVKRRQREFFAAIYQLICSSDTGPRLPTLFLSIGFDRARKLLAPSA